MLNRATFCLLCGLTFLVPGTFFLTAFRAFSPTHSYGNRTKRNTQHLSPEATRQTRKNSSKEVWGIQEKGPYHYKLTALTSTLFLAPSTGRSTVLEEMEELECYLLEEVRNDGEGKAIDQLRYIQASKGQLNYSTKQVQLPGGHFNYFELPPSKAPFEQVKTASPILKGIAHKIHLSLKKDQPTFSGEGLNMQLALDDKP